MSSQKLISMLLCASMLVSSCIVLTTNVQAAGAEGWGSPALMDAGISYPGATEPQIAMNDYGDAVVAWSYGDGSSFQVKARLYSDGAWESVSTISSTSTGIGSVQVAINDDGYAVVAWQQFGTEVYDIYANIYTGIWGTPTALSDSTESAQEPRVAIDSGGNAVVIWKQNSPSVGYILSNVYYGGSWSGVRPVSDGIRSAQSPQLTMDDGGYAIAAWEQNSGTVTRIASCIFFMNASSWGPIVEVSDPGFSSLNCDIAGYTSGQAILVWEQYDGSNYNLKSSIMLGGAWGAVQTIAYGVTTNSVPQVVMNGLAVATWVKETGSIREIHASIYADGSWGPDTTISDPAYSSVNGRVGISADGDAMVIWSQSGSSDLMIVSNGYVDGNWTGVEAISNSGQDAYLPSITMNSTGAAMATWYVADDINIIGSVYVNTYVPLTLPTVAIDSPAEDNILGTDDVVLTWTGERAVSYSVSVDGSVISSTTGTSITISDLLDGEHNLKVTAFNDAGENATAQVNITVDTTLPTLTIDIPSAGAWFNTTAINVTWTASDASGIANMSVSMDGEPFVDVTTSYKVFNSLADGPHTVFVRVYDNAGNSRSLTKDFNIQAVLPVLNITDPEDDAVINSGNIIVSWNGTSASGVGNYWISVDNDEFIDVDLNTSYVLISLTEGDHTVTLKALDFAGNWNTTSVNFIVDTVAPVVNITSPARDLHTTERNVTVEWTVSESGSGPDSVEISIDGGDWISVAENSYALKNLTDGSHTVAVWATDVAGNSDLELVVLFVDNVAPTATISPSGDNVAIGSVIVVEFSEAMNSTSASIVVNGIEGAIAWNGNVATFTPSVALAYDTAYTISVHGEDLAGNNMAAESTFTTMKNECTISGIVKDANGNVVANATVTLSNGVSTTTDANGRFEFVGVTSGSFTMTITKDGFQTITQTVSASAGQTTDLATLSIAKTASENGDDGSTLWIFGIIGVVVIAILGAAFVMYRKKKT